AGDGKRRLGGAFNLGSSVARSAARRSRRDCARRWRRTRRNSRAGLCPALETGRTPRSDRPPAARHGFQRSAQGTHTGFHGGRAMNTDATHEPDQLIADAIEGAEEMPDPLAGLAEKTAADPGAPFMPEALEALAALRQNNRAAFEALRSQLKKAGCRVTALDDAIAEENGTPSGRGPTQAGVL